MSAASVTLSGLTSTPLPRVGQRRRWRYGVGHDGGLSRDRLDEMFQHCADLGVDVEWADLGTVRHGGYLSDLDRIVLNRRLTRRRTISCLAHELGHRAFGDTCSTPPVERRAWEYAAALLIAPNEYACAEERVGHHPGDLAFELDVTVRVIEAWRRWWEKRGHVLHSACCGQSQ